MIALVTLACIEWRRAAASEEARRWRAEAQAGASAASELRQRHDKLVKEYGELRSWADDLQQRHFRSSSERSNGGGSRDPGIVNPRAAAAATAAAAANRSSATSRFDSRPDVVDYVFMWVDASNQRVQATIAEAVAKKVIRQRPHNKRVRDDGTFQFAIRSVLQAPKLEAAIRNVYVVTSGEVPPWLLPWLGDVPAQVRSSCFTDEPLSAPLQPLVDKCQGVERRQGPVPPRRLYLYPHRQLFSDAAHELPTFNSNAILAVLHRLPDLSRWFIYSDDDMVASQPNVGLDFWWEEDADRCAAPQA